MKGQNAAKAASDFFNEGTKDSKSSTVVRVVSGYQTNVDAGSGIVDPRMIAYLTTGEYPNETSEQAPKNIIQETESLINQRSEIEKQYSNILNKQSGVADINGDEYKKLGKQADEYKAKLDELDGKIVENTSLIESHYESLFNDDGTVISDYEGLVKQINGLFDLLDTDKGIKGFLSKKNNEGLEKRLKEIYSTNGEEGLKKLISDTNGLESALNDAGISADALIKYIEKLTGTDFLPLSQKIDKLKISYIGNGNPQSQKQKSYDFDNFLKDKTDEQKEKFYQYIQENGLDISSWNLEDLEYNFKISISVDDKNSEGAFTSAISKVESLSDGLDQLKDIYNDVKDAGDFDYSKMLNNDSFKSAFGDLDEYNDFVKTVSNSPKDIEACQSAFNKLVKSYILGSDVLKDLDESERDATVSLLEQMGVANASEIVDKAISANKRGLVMLSEDYANKTYDQITAEYAAAESGSALQKALAKLALEKAKINGISINTKGDIDQIIALANAAGASEAALIKLNEVKLAFQNANNYSKLSLKEKQMTGEDPSSSVKKATGQIIRDLKNGKFDFDYEELDPNDFMPDVIFNPKDDSSSGNGSSKTESKAKEAIDKLKDWTSKFFDWIEIKIKRQSDNISKYISKAESDLEKQSYRSSASNYNKAIKATISQVSNEDVAASKYSDKADSILSKAVKLGIISKKTSKTIKDSVASGRMDISRYNDSVQEVIKSYQEWYDKSQDAKNSITELHKNIKEYVDSLKSVREAQRDATIEKNENREKIVTSGISSTAGTKNQHLDFSIQQLKNKDEAYKNSTNNAFKDVNATSESVNKDVNKQLKSKKAKNDKKYKKALNNAKQAISSRKPVSDDDMEVIYSKNKTLYSNLFEYNLKIEELETAKLEEAVNYASVSAEIFNKTAEKYKNKDEKTNSDIDLLKSKASNATSYKTANSLLNSAAQKYDTILNDDRLEIQSYKNNMASQQKVIAKKGSAKGSYKGDKYSKLSKNSDTKKKVDACINAAKAAAKSGKVISDSTISNIEKYYLQGYISSDFYNACINYNNAIESKKQAEAQYEIDKQTAVSERASLGTEKFNNVKEKYESDLNANSNNTSKISAQQALKESRGQTLTKDDYKSLIIQSQKDQKIYENEKSALQSTINENLNRGLWTKDSKQYKDAIGELEKLDVSIINCKKDQQEFNNSITMLDINKLESALEVIESYKSYIESINSLIEARGEKLKDTDYQKLIAQNNESIANAQQQANKYWKQYLLAKDEANNSTGKTAQEWLTLYNKEMTSVNGLLKENESLYDSIWQTYVEPFDEACQHLSNYCNLIEKTSSLLNSDNFVDDNGDFTNQGLAQLSNYLKEFGAKRSAIAEKQNEINKLRYLKDTGTAGLSDKEYEEKMQTLREELLSLTSDEKSVTESLIGLWKNAGQTEIDSIKKVIDARKEALKAKKDYYEYDKNLKSQTKDIQLLESQIAALQGIETAEAKAKKATLEANLAEKQESLQDTIQSHLYDIKVDGLDELQTTLQENYDDYIKSLSESYDKIKELVENSTDLVAGSYEKIYNAFEETFRYFGIDSKYLPVNYAGFQSFAGGSKKIPNNMLAWTQDDGSEIIVRSDGAILTPLTKGSAVIPNNLSENLFELGKYSPSDILKQSDLYRVSPKASSVQSINVHYDSLLRVDGNVDKDALPELKTILEKSYQYTVQNISKEARMNGIKK
ncbi:MAG: hypothetical protein PUB94_05910 [Oscillospiraceae bacterium]|nr:hypothetical protein [Oscillospiraceae bacterium]